MNKVCLGHDWQDSRAFDFIASLTGEACAWEALRRNARYQDRWRRWQRRRRKGQDRPSRFAVKRLRKRQDEAEAEGLHRFPGPAAERP